jgi:RimJ/RimL family protein N-acetyltransferase
LPDVAELFGSILGELPYYNQIAKRSESQKYTLPALRGKLRGDPYSVLVARDALGHVGGFCMTHFDDYTIWLDWFGVDPRMRRSGVGTKLLKLAFRTVKVRGAHKIWCDCRSNNAPSKRILLKLGFSKVALIRHHWYGQDFIIWQRAI